METEAREGKDLLLLIHVHVVERHLPVILAVGTVAVVVRKMTTVAPTLSYVVIIIITILVGLVEPLGLVRATINLELTVVADRLAELTQVLVARAATLVLLESLVTMERQVQTVIAQMVLLVLMVVLQVEL